MSTALISWVLPLSQSKKGFMNKSSGFQGVRIPLTLQMPGSKLLKLAVNQGYQRMEGVLIAGVDPLQDLGNLHGRLPIVQRCRTTLHPCHGVPCIRKSPV